MATPRDAVTLLRRLNINGAGLNGIGGGSRAAGRARAPRPAAQRRFLATPAKPQPAEPDATLKLAMGVIDAEAARVRASLAALDAQLAALPSDSPDRAALLSQKKHAEAALVFGDLSAHRELALGVRTARTLPLRHDAFEARRLPVLLDHAKRDGTLWDIFGHWEFEPKVDVSISFGAEEGLGKANVYKGEPSDCRFNAPVIRVEGWDGDDVRPAEGRYLSVVVMDLDYPRLDTSSYEPILLSLHTNIPYNPASTLSLNLSSTENAVLPYLPPHPAKQNPNLWHRIVVMVCEQTEKIEVAVPAPAAQEVSQRSEWVKDEDGPKEKELKIRERLEMLPFLKLARKHALEPIGFGYWKAEWTPRASAIFTKLGLHEPVLASLPKDISAFSRALSRTPSELLKLATGRPAEKTYDKAKTRAGLVEPTSDRARMPTLADETIAKMEEMARQAAEKKAGKGGKGAPAQPAKEVKVELRKREAKRAGPVDVARVVREREGREGVVTKYYKESGRRGRYTNV